MTKLFLVTHYLLKELTLQVNSFKTINKLNELKMEFDLIENEKFLIVQIIHIFLSLWKQIMRNYTEIINNPGLSFDNKNIKYFL